MDARYFFIKDRIESENITIEYCPTELMMADFFTKPLQGNLFRKFRDVIMGHKHIDSLKDPAEYPSSQERVRENISEDGHLGADGNTSAETNDNMSGKNENNDDRSKRGKIMNGRKRKLVDERKRENRIILKRVSFFSDNPN
jgi:hypothetical protein